MAVESEQQLRAYVEYLRDLGVHDFYRQGEPVVADVSTDAAAPADLVARPLPVEAAVAKEPETTPVPTPPVATRPAFLEPPIAKLVSFDDLAPLPESRVAPAHKPDALIAIQEEIGDCTRCPLAYAGRRTIVFGDGDANARLMFVGEGPGADEDASGVPFVGKAGQLLNNMIQAMGLKREQVYIANIVKCRPPANRVPEPVEANTCDPFLLRQIDVVQPEVIVALGSTAATYLLGVKQSLSSLRGRWHSCRDAKLVVTYHPAYLLRDPQMKGEAWKDLQKVMAQMGLKAPAKG
jgi:uracil-DNA glycosylase